MEMTFIGRMSPMLPNVFLDVDDVVLNSSKAAIAILNKKHGQRKSVEDVTDWEYKSLFPNTTTEEIEEVFASDEFWETVEFFPAFQEWVLDDKHDILSKFNWIYLTKGGKDSLAQKCDFLNAHNTDKTRDVFTYYGLNLSESKSNIHMWGGIQIDDNWDNLRDTDADVKILVKNYKDTTYNQMGAESPLHENVYVVNTLDEAFEILRFISVMEELEQDAEVPSFFADMQTEFDDELLPLNMFK